MCNPVLVLCDHFDYSFDVSHRHLVVPWDDLFQRTFHSLTTFPAVLSYIQYQAVSLLNMLYIQYQVVRLLDMMYIQYQAVSLLDMMYIQYQEVSLLDMMYCTYSIKKLVY